MVIKVVQTLPKVLVFTVFTFTWQPWRSSTNSANVSMPGNPRFCNALVPFMCKLHRSQLRRYFYHQSVSTKENTIFSNCEFITYIAVRYQLTFSKIKFHATFNSSKLKRLMVCCKLKRCSIHLSYIKCNCALCKVTLRPTVLLSTISSVFSCGLKWGMTGHADSEVFSVSKPRCNSAFQFHYFGLTLSMGQWCWHNGEWILL